MNSEMDGFREVDLGRCGQKKAEFGAKSWETRANPGVACRAIKTVRTETTDGLQQVGLWGSRTSRARLAELIAEEGNDRRGSLQFSPVHT